jgi:hypothetical protein
VKYRAPYVEVAEEKAYNAQEEAKAVRAVAAKAAADDAAAAATAAGDAAAAAQ